MNSAIDLATRLVNIADMMVENRATQISDEALRTLKDEVRKGRTQNSEAEFAIDYEASCLVNCIAELAWARSEGDRRREERALMYINSFRTFVRMDVDRAVRQAITP